MKRIAFIALLFSLGFAAACKASNNPPVSSSPSSSPAPTEDAETKTAREEAEAQGDNFRESRTVARIAAQQYIKAELPEWTLKGMASQESYEQNVFLVDVDVEKGKQHRVLSLIVEQFFTEKGPPYWKASPLDVSHAIQLHYARDASKEQELEDATDKINQ